MSVLRDNQNKEYLHLITIIVFNVVSSYEPVTNCADVNIGQKKNHINIPKFVRLAHKRAEWYNTMGSSWTPSAMTFNVFNCAICTIFTPISSAQLST